MLIYASCPYVILEMQQCGGQDRSNLQEFEMVKNRIWASVEHGPAFLLLISRLRCSASHWQIIYDQIILEVLVSYQVFALCKSKREVRELYRIK